MDVNEIEIFVKFKKEFFLGGGGGGVVGVGLGGQSGCERRIEVFVKIQKKKNWGGGFRWGGGWWGGGWGGRVGLGGQSGCERRIEVFVKIQKKNFLGGGGWGGGGGGRWGVGVVGQKLKKYHMNFFQFFVKYSIYHPLSADTSFKFLAIILFENGIYKISSPCLSKGRNLTRGDNSGKTRNMRRLFFHEESIHEVSRRYLEHEYIHTYVHTDKPKPICPPTF